jgi:predicted nucleotidyltransferase
MITWNAADVSSMPVASVMFCNELIRSGSPLWKAARCSLFRSSCNEISIVISVASTDVFETVDSQYTSIKFVQRRWKKGTALVLLLPLMKLYKPPTNVSTDKQSNMAGCVITERKGYVSATKVACPSVCDTMLRSA